MKIGLLGLDAAGKTSFIMGLSKKFSTVPNLKPTKGIERNIVNILGFEVAMWDFGGQKNYRDKYLRTSKDLKGLDILYFVIDIQDSKRLDEALSYLEDILKVIKDFNKEHLVLCIHKADADFQETNEFDKNLEKIQETLDNLAPEAYALPWTTIFDENSLISAFSMGLRMITSRREVVENWMEKLLDDTKSSALVLLNRNYVIAKSAFDPSVGDMCEKVALTLVGLEQKVQGSLLTSEKMVGYLKHGIYIMTPQKVDGHDLFLILYSAEHETPEELMKLADDSLSQLPGLIATFGSLG